MRVAGFGFNDQASEASLYAALVLAGGSTGLGALATLTQKAASPAFLALAQTLGLPVIVIDPALLAGQATITRSVRIIERFKTGSVSEALALIAAGPNARLIGPRAISADHRATAAIAEGERL